MVKAGGGVASASGTKVTWLKMEIRRLYKGDGSKCHQSHASNRCQIGVYANGMLFYTQRTKNSS